MAKDRYEIDFIPNPTFDTVNGLSNITFDPSDIRSGYMATEDQIFDLYNRTIVAGQTLSKCCKKMLVWETYVQIVRLHSNTLQIRNGTTLPNFTAGGVVVSHFDENRRSGFMRRGEPYTVTFSVPWDGVLYCPVTPVNGHPDCKPYASNGAWIFTEFSNRVSYREVRDASIIDACTLSDNDRRAYFLVLPSNPAGSNPTDANNLQEINYRSNWGGFTRSIASNGTISITDHRALTDFNIIRYYVQFTLNTCSDGTSLRTAIEPVIAQWNASHSESERLFYGP